MNYFKENKAVIALALFSTVFFGIFYSSYTEIGESGDVSLKNLSIVAPKSSVYIDNMRYKTSLTELYVKVNPDKLSYYQKVLVVLNEKDLYIYFFFILPFLLLLYFYYMFNGTLFNKRAEPIVLVLISSAFVLFNFYFSFVDKEINKFALSLIENNKDYYVKTKFSTSLSPYIGMCAIVLYSYIKKLKAQIVIQNQYFGQ